MKQRVVRNRLMELIQERERKMGRRVKQRDIAQFVGVADHTITHWIRNEVTKFESDIITGLCDYFDCEINDLLYIETIEYEDKNS
jgi:DNA-binding Xre family transcriptional regulator